MQGNLTKSILVSNIPWFKIWMTLLMLIVILSIFGRQLQRMVSVYVDERTNAWIIASITIVFLLILLYHVTKTNATKAYWHFLWLIPIYVVSPLMLPNVEERIHFPLFAAFGFVTLMQYRPLSGFVICLFVASADELLQFILPNRVGDLRDVAINVIASFGGALLAIGITRKSIFT